MTDAERDTFAAAVQEARRIIANSLGAYWGIDPEALLAREPTEDEKFWAFMAMKSTQRQLAEEA